MWKLVVCALLIAQGAFAKQQDVYPKVKEGIQELIKTGNKPTYLVEAVKTVNFTHLFRDSYEHHVADELTCDACYTIVDEFVALRKNGADRDEFIGALAGVCSVLNIESERVCQGDADIYANSLLHIIDNGTDVTGDRFCALVLQHLNCPNNGHYDWDIEIPEGYSPEKEPPSANAGQFNIGLISDIHYDPLYTAGKTSTCNEPLCCQDDQSDASGDGDSCGYWSSYKHADTPLHTVDAVLTHIKNHNLAYVYFTGDIISHRSWSTSKENNTRDIQTIIQKFRDSFEVPVYPILGNHEPSPAHLYSVNVKDCCDESTQWLFNLVADEWATWLPEDAQATARLGGYYTVLARPGFRVVVLNSNVCYTSNVWLVFEDNDPYGQLAWLVQVLAEAEQNQESVHILSHMPTGSSSCISVWARNFNKIVSRFANTITGIFNGHTHKDEWQIYYNTSNPDQAVNVAFNGGSVTPFSDGNPNYRVLHINNETFTNNGICQWTFNLTSANLNPDVAPEWYELYMFKQAYQVPSMLPSDINDLAYRMAANQTLIKQFHNFRYKNSDVANSQKCNEACQKNILCVISVTDFADRKKCEELQQIWDDNFGGK